MKSGSGDLSHFRGGNSCLSPPLPTCNNCQTNTLEYITKQDRGRGWSANRCLFSKAIFVFIPGSINVTKDPAEPNT
ncbi:hypothetical protein E2C01_036585 [Portunus trituberculatus]|uniref:Uncharacterized protein n=1 Tax=Portunus trituberculatus TaxID=210409 RepID=A0A5B7F5Y1_PORTR|nr:hypothetical protein [Portunus trituberculatus]